MENGIWRFASATSRHPAEPGKYSALSAFGGFVTLASAKIDRRPGQPSVNAVRMASALIADKAFDADKRVIEPLRAAGKTALIPPKSTARNRATSTVTSTRRGIYKAWHLISRTSSPGSSRAIATRYDKTAATSSPPSTSLPASFGSIDRP